MMKILLKETFWEVVFSGRTLCSRYIADNACTGLSTWKPCQIIIRANPFLRVFKRLAFLAIVFFIYSLSGAVYAQGNMSIGVAMPDASAQLHLSATNKGLLIPRLTSSQRGLIVAPANGLLVYEINSDRFYFNEGSSKSPVWRYLLSEADLPLVAVWQLNGNNVHPSNYLGTSNATNLPLRINGKQVGLFPANHSWVKLGLDAGRLANGSAIIALGNNALVSATSLPNLIAIGDSALHHFSAASTYPNYHQGKVIAIGGRAAMYGSNENSVYEQNLAVGYGALNGIASANNVAVGYFALAGGTSGGILLHNNVGIGWRVLGKLNQGYGNTAIGYTAGNNQQAGFGNTFLGYNANVPVGTTDNINNATAIGANSLVSTSNTMAFGNSSSQLFLLGLSGPSIGGVAFQVNQYTGGGIFPYLTKTGTWSNLSDSASKTNITAINETEFWQQIKALPITEWQYKGDSALHIGPMAQDFYSTLKLGDDDKAISTIDPTGVALAALKILIKKNKALKLRIEELEQNRGMVYQ